MEDDEDSKTSGAGVPAARRGARPHEGAEVRGTGAGPRIGDGRVAVADR
jgi:hypothetical protein